MFTVTANSGTKAVAEARRAAQAQGMSRILVNYVMELEKVAIEHAPCYGAPLAALGATFLDSDCGTLFSGLVKPTEVPVLSVSEINITIEGVWHRLVSIVPRPDRPPLKAYQLDGRVFIDDGVSGRHELHERTNFELAMLLYDWVTYVGYYCGDFENFVEESWLG